MEKIEDQVVAHLRQQLEKFIPQTPQERKDYECMLEYSTFPHILERSNTCVHMTASSLIVNEERTHVLLAYHRIFDSFAWTGGHADGESDLFSVAFREALEETGLTTLSVYSKDIISVELLPVWGHVKNGSYVSAHLHANVSYVFIGDMTLPIQPNIEEHTEVAWIPIKEISKYVKEPYMYTIYTKILNRLQDKI